MADTGFINCGTGADNAGVGTEVWGSPGRVTASDNSDAAVTLTDSEVSHYLAASNHTNGLPVGATIDGIETQYEADMFGASSAIVTSCKLLDAAGSVVGDEKGDSRAWMDADNLDQFGGASDLWGTTPTKASLDDSDSGWVISATSSSSTTFVRLDAMWRKIYYTAAGGVTMPIFYHHQRELMQKAR